jgi:hypothetical protein
MKKYRTKYQTEEEKAEAAKESKRNYYYRNKLESGKVPKPFKNKQVQAAQEKDLKELILGLKQDIAGLRELITAQASK